MEVTLFEPQYKMLTTNRKIAAFVGGIGAGKTFTLKHFVLRMITEFPRTKGLIVANTYKQLRDTTIPAVLGWLDELNIKYKYITDKKIKIGKTEIFIYSLEYYSVIRGIEVGWIAGDEVSFASLAAINVCFGRLRCTKGPRWARFFTSPNGFNWLYDFVNNTELNVELITMRTYDNKNLTQDYIDNLIISYGGKDSPLTKQEVEGQFISQTSSSVYFAFDRLKHVKPVEDDKNKIVYVGCDFNAGNMNYVAFQFDGKRFKILKAKKLKDHTANTFTMGQEIQNLYGSRARVIPDSTGRARKSSAHAGLTDIKILENAGLHVLGSNNPLIKDRQNTVNLHFIKNLIDINDKDTQDLIAELEKLSNQDDEGKVSHLAVAMGYGIYHLNPILKREDASVNSINPFLGKR